MQARLSEGPPIGVPTIVLHGADDGATLPSATEDQEARFTGGYARELLPAIGHFPPREAPAEVAAAVLRLVRGGAGLRRVACGGVAEGRLAAAPTMTGAGCWRRSVAAHGAA